MIVRRMKNSLVVAKASALMLLLLVWANERCEQRSVEGYVNAFTSIVAIPRVAQQPPKQQLPIVRYDSEHRMKLSDTVLFAVKKKMNAASAAALAALDEEENKSQPQQTSSWKLEDEDDEDDMKLSKKDLKKALASKKGKSKSINVEDVVASIKTATSSSDTLEEKEQNDVHIKNGKDQHQNDDAVEKNGNENPTVATGTKSKRELMLEKALELEKADMNDEESSPYKEEKAPKLTAKELKALQKKEEKMAAKLEKKLAKKALAKDDDESGDETDEDTKSNVDDIDLVGNDDNNVDTETTDNDAIEPEVEVESITLEDKIRKERPPPRIRVMENTAQGYTSLRLENVGITFRNQQVLKDVTWGVQTGDRIGLVGANGAGMC
jgi:hypothetical protein